MANSYQDYEARINIQNNKKQEILQAKSARVRKNRTPFYFSN